MKKIAVSLFVVILCLLMTSCLSLFPQMEEKPTAKTGNRERTTAAILLLGSDMMKNVNAEPTKASALESILPESYVFYKEYAPSYEALKENYLNSVGEYSFGILLGYSNTLTNEIQKLAKMPTLYVSGDDTLSTKMREDLWVKLYDNLVAELRLNRSELESYFSQSRQNFEEIRKAYANLSAVGVEFQLDVPEPVELERLAEAVVNDYFNRLAWYEKFLKNTPAESGTLYTVFWEN